MAAPFEFDLSGSEELQRLFDEFEPRIAKGALRKAMRRGINLIFQHIKSITPVLQYDKKGRIRGALKRHLKVRAIARSRRRFGVQIMTPTREQLGVDAKEKGYYPLHVEEEFGGKDSYLRRGWDQREKAAVAVIEHELGAEIERLWQSA